MPRLKPGATVMPMPATPPPVDRLSPGNPDCAPVRADVPYPSNQLRYTGDAKSADAPPPALLSRAAYPAAAARPMRCRKLLPRSSCAAATMPSLAFAQFAPPQPLYTATSASAARDSASAGRARFAADL